LLLVLLAVGIVLLDQLSKYLVYSQLQAGESIPVINGIINVTHVKNAGAAFGIMQDKRILFIVAHLVLITAVAYFYKTIKQEGIIALIAAGLMLGGASGNMIDRVTTGYVVDFIDFRIWPVFNIADTAIVIGAILLGFQLLTSLREADSKSPKISEEMLTEKNDANQNRD
jgi:signal peptidase II